MSDPTSPTPYTPAPSPFDRPDAGPAPGQAPPPRGGVRKPLLIGCGTIVLLMVAAMVLVVVNQHALVGWLLEAMHGELEARMPEDLPPEVRARYDDAFERAVAAAREGRYTPESLQRVQRVFTRSVQGGGARLSVTEVERLADELETFADGAPAAAPEEPAAPEPGRDEAGRDGAAGSPADPAGVDG